jgi:hypothetical protein
VNAKGKVISTLLVIDTFFVSYAAGFNSRHVLMVDPNLSAYIAKPEPVPSIDADKQATKKPATKPSDTSANKSAGKSTDKSPISTVKGNHAGAGASKHPTDARKETKSSSNSVHKPAHSAQKATPKETD